MTALRWSSASRRERRLIGILTLVIVLGLAARLGPWWWHETRSVAASRDDAQAELDRVIGAIEWARDASPTIDETKARFDELRPRLLTGGTAERATGTLVALLSDLAGAAGLSVDEITEIRPPDGNGPASLEARGVRVVGSGDLTALVVVLSHVEGGPGLLRIRRFALSQPSVAAEDSQTEILRFELVVEGLVRVEATEGGR